MATGLLIKNPSSCLVQVRWDWTTSSDPSRWSAEFQAYRYRQLYVPADANDSLSYGYSVITTRSKVRGNGRALCIKFSTEAGKDLQLLGWNLEIGANKEP